MEFPLKFLQEIFIVAEFLHDFLMEKFPIFFVEFS